MKYVFPAIKTHSFRDRVFRIFWRRYRRAHDEIPGQNFGYCDHRETPHPKIHIYPNQPALELLLTVAHESLHACCPDIDDAVVQEYEDELGRLLRRMKVKVEFEQ